MKSQPETIPELLQLSVEKRPHAPACYSKLKSAEWTPTTWMQLADEIERSAHALVRLGLKKGDRLAVLSHTRQEWFVAEMAGLKAGAIIVGIDPHAGSEQAAYVIQHSGACALIVDSRESLSLLSKDLCEHFKFIASFEETTSACTTDGPPQFNWCDIASAHLDKTVTKWSDPGANDPAALIYTSGSTGTPKGILYSHKQLMVACQCLAETFPELDAKGRALCWLPMAHLYQRMMNFHAMVCGMATYFLDNPREISAALREVEPALFIGVPRVYEKIREGIFARIEAAPGWQKKLICAALTAGAEKSRCERAGMKPSWQLRLKHAVLDALVLRKIRRAMGRNLKFMVTGSAPAAPSVLEFFHSTGLLILEAYGLSENTVPIAINRLKSFRFGSVGKPLSPNEIRIQMDGEILVRGAGLFNGYYGESKSESQFTDDGFYRSGDCGYIDADGFLYLTGRKTEIIKTSTGRRIAPAQIEAAYRQSRFIDQIVVVGNGRKHLAGLIALNADALNKDLRGKWNWSDIREESVQLLVRAVIERELERCGRALAPHERIKDFVILSEPLSAANGALTTSLKLRRNWIEFRYKDLIEGLYGNRKPQQSVSQAPALAEMSAL